MIQVSGNFTGKPAPSVAILDENGHRFPLVFESSARWYVLIPDEGLKPWGVTILYGTQSARFVLPAQPGAYEAADIGMTPALLTFASAMPRVIHQGTQLLLETGGAYDWCQMTGFCDYQLFLTGQHGPLHAVWQQAKDLGFNGRRVFGHMHYITEFGIQTVGETAWLTNLQAFCAAAAEYDQRIDFNVFCDMQAINLPLAQQQAIWIEAARILVGQPNGFATLGNELSKNGIDPNAFAYPGVPCSQGSAVSDTAPPMPGWGRREWHGRRDGPIKVYLSADDMKYVEQGYDEASGHYYAPAQVTIHTEPMGAAEVDIPGRRSTDPALFASLRRTARAYGWGITGHFEDAIYSRPLGPIQQACARALTGAV